MSAYWVRFEKRKAACVESADGIEAAAKLAEELGSDKVTSIRPLPYPANPRLNELIHPKYGVCPSFCYRPGECAGHSCCPQNYSCTE